MTLPILFAVGSLATVAGLISLLVWLLILALVCGIIYWILQLLPLPAPIRQIITVILAVAVLLLCVAMLVGGHPVLPR